MRLTGIKALTSVLSALRNDTTFLIPPTDSGIHARFNGIFGKK